MAITQSFPRDANGVPIDTLGLIEPKTVTFDGLAGSGAAGTVSLYTVTGAVVLSLFGHCTVNLTSAGGGTLEVGIAGNTASLIAQTTATEIDANEVWIDNAPATVEALPAQKILVNGTDIIATVGTADITAGAIVFYCAWTPLTSGSSLVAA